jgi:two-component system nitrogen regulation response regulator NtrX
MARLLLVDDEPDIRQMLHDGLVLRGHDVHLAGSADEALRLAKVTSFEVAIIDYVLPGKRGLELLQELRAVNPFLRAIIISGQIDHDVLSTRELESQLQERIAADKYLPKPASIEALSQAVKDVLQPADEGNWETLAKEAVQAQDVKRRDVQEMDRVLRKNQRKKK